MDLLEAIKLATSGLKAQSGRMRVVAENLANADSTAQKPGEAPYKRRIPSFSSHLDPQTGGRTVQLGRVRLDTKPFRLRYEPGHPAADEKGYVQLPNVNSLVELTDYREAQRSYEANLNVIEGSRKMIGATLDILKGA